MALEENIIQLKHMGKEFKTANGPVKALDDINLEIKRGEIFRNHRVFPERGNSTLAALHQHAGDSNLR